MTSDQLREKATLEEMALKKAGFAAQTIIELSKIPHCPENDRTSAKARRSLNNFFDSDSADNVSVDWNTSQVMESTCTP